MRMDQFYPIRAGGAASSKAFWPGLHPSCIAVLQETHQTHERATSRVTELWLHHRSLHLSLYLNFCYFLWWFMQRLTETATYSFALIMYQLLFKLALDRRSYKCNLVLCFQFDCNSEYTLIIQLTQDNIIKNIILWIHFKAPKLLFSTL